MLLTVAIYTLILNLCWIVTNAKPRLRSHTINYLFNNNECNQFHNVTLVNTNYSYALIRVEILTDNNPEKISWEVIDMKSNNIVLNGRKYKEPKTVYENSTCIQKGSNTYKFIFHNEGDFGSYASHNYKLFLNNVEIAAKYRTANSEITTQAALFNACLMDSDCDDGFLCTKDKCNTETFQCSNELLKESPDECVAFGTKRAIAIRVIAKDADTSKSSNQLSKFIFENEFTGLNYFATCSYGRFNIIPYTGWSLTNEKIQNGIVEIELSSNVIGKQVGEVEDQVLLAATEKLGNLESQFDFVMLCIPPGTLIGTSENWRAFALIDSFLTVYNDDNCIYPSVQMHEIGHNLGLSHSNDEQTYGDEVGMMGISTSDTDGPKKCFNAPKSWELRWYEDSHYRLDLKEMKTATVTITGIANYKERGDLPTLIKTINGNDGFDYYISFNTNSKMNSGTSEGINQILITKRLTGTLFDDSVLMGKLSNDDSFNIFNFDDGLNLRIWARKIKLNASPVPFAEVFLAKVPLFCREDQQCDDLSSCTIDACEQIAVDDYIDDAYQELSHCTHVQLPCSDCGAFVTVSGSTNDQPRELFWSVREIKLDQIVRSSGYYQDLYEEFDEKFCLGYGKYLFSIIYSGDTTDLSNGASYSFLVEGEVIDEDVFIEEDFFDTIFIICKTDLDCVDYDGCTVDICNPNKRLCDNSADPNNCDSCTIFNINIITDNFPDETSWSLKNIDKNDLVMIGDPFPLFTVGFGRRKAPTRSGRRSKPTRIDSQYERRRRQRKRRMEVSDLAEVFDETICLINDFAYFFQIEDLFGDGICCSEGSGEYSLTIEDTTLKRGGDFEFSDNFLFSLTPCSSDQQCDDGDSCTIDKCLTEISTCVYTTRPCTECGALVKIYIVTDYAPYQTFWRLNSEEGEILSGGPYARSHELQEDSKCLSWGSYRFSIFDKFGDGMNFCLADGIECGYSLLINDNIIVNEDGSFAFEEHSYFGVCFKNSHCNDDDNCTEDICDLSRNACTFEPLCSGPSNPLTGAPSPQPIKRKKKEKKKEDEKEKKEEKQSKV